MLRPHVTLVCWGFPPFRGSGAFRPLALANALAAAGARVTVIAAARETFLLHYGADEALESQLADGVTVRHVPFWPENHWPLVNDWGPVRSRDARAFAAKRNRVVPAFPEKVYDTWLPRVTEELRDLAQSDQPDLIIGTGAPYGDLEAALTVGTDLQVPVILDDRDSFLADVFTGGEHPLFAERRPFGERWLRTAAELWFVNPPIAEWHRQRWPEARDRIHVVENGWDPGVVDQTRIRPSPGRTVRMGYVGLVPSNFPMDTVLAAWARNWEGQEGAVELVFTGPLGYEVGSPRWRAAEAAIEAAPGVRWQGHLSRTGLSDVYAGLDALLLAKEGGVMVTGGKTYEYGATGLPIAGVVDPGSDAVRVLSTSTRFHPAADTTVDGAAAAIRAAIADARAGTPELLAEAQAAGRSLSREAVLAPAVQRILGLVRS